MSVYEIQFECAYKKAKSLNAKLTFQHSELNCIGYPCILCVVVFWLVPQLSSSDILAWHLPLPTHETQRANSLQQGGIYAKLHDL